MEGRSVDNLACSTGSSINYFFKWGYHRINLLRQVLWIWSTLNLELSITFLSFFTLLSSYVSDSWMSVIFMVTWITDWKSVIQMFSPMSNVLWSEWSSNVNTCWMLKNGLNLEGHLNIDQCCSVSWWFWQPLCSHDHLNTKQFYLYFKWSHD